MALSGTARAEARFKQLCCLGLGGEAVMPALLRELRAIIPSSGSTFFFADARGQLVNIFDENPESPHIASLYMEEFAGRRDHEVGISFSDALQTEFGVNCLQEILPIDLSAYLRTDQYNLIMRPLGYDDYIRLMIRNDGRGLGGVMLSRSRGERPFTPDERRRLAALESFFAHALTAPTLAEAPLVESDVNGLIVADPGGRVVYSSAEGRRLLFLATHVRTGPDAGFWRRTCLPPAVVALCRNIADIFSGDALAAVPSCRHRNVWGGFVFRAQWLDGSDAASGLIGITVTYEEPIQTKMIRRIGDFPLSPRQAQVCFMIANGSTNDEIADRLGISKHTVVAHGRWIYNELDVHSRAELVSKLLAV